MAGDFESAMQDAYEVTTALTGMGQLEACADNLDLSSCWPLLADVTVKSKLKWVEQSYDTLRKLYKVNKLCKKADAAAQRFGVQRAASTQAKADSPKWACGSFLKAYDNDGMIIADAKDGVLSMAVERNGSTTKGYQMFDDVMAHFGPDKIKAIEAKWVSSMPTNLNKFNELIRAGKTPEEAAAGAFTGRNAARYGLTKVRVTKAKGQPGHYTDVEVLFER
jgi:hypothetical protein